MNLKHRHFIIGITGGIAAYKSCELVRRLQDEGATVQVVMTEAGTRFVSALTFQALSGRPVYANPWTSPQHSGPDNGMAHIDLAREADAVLVAPASADFIAQLATGQATSLLATLCLARDIPLLLAPAMNRQMWMNPSTQRNIGLLKNDGIDILGPGVGAQACGESGDGRMLEPDELLKALMIRFGPTSSAPPVSSLPNIRGVLQDKHVVITAGPTFEPIDPVRGITNRSSGKMGFAIAQAAIDAGAQVTLISGPVHLPTPQKTVRIDVTTAQDMHDAVMKTLRSAPADIFIGVAAVADWRPKSFVDSKMKKGGASLEHIEWVENPDILAAVARLPHAPYCVGFAAESGTPESLAGLLPSKRERKGVGLLVGNIGPDTFGADDNHILLCDDVGIQGIGGNSKANLGRILISEIAKRVGNG